MKKVSFILFFSLCVVCFTKCKPAAEDRAKMHENANRIADSIGRAIDAAMAEVKIEPSTAQPATDTSKKVK